MNVENLLKVYNKDTRTMSLTSFDVIIVNFTHISHLALVFLVFLLLTWIRQNPGWVVKAIVQKP